MFNKFHVDLARAWPGETLYIVPGGTKFRTPWPGIPGVNYSMLTAFMVAMGITGFLSIFFNRVLVYFQ